jgi:transposase InsO family protein
MLHVDEVHGNAAPVHAVLDDGRRHVVAWRAARSSAPASVVLQTHRTAVAGRSPRSIASSIAWKLVPPPEAKTAKRRGAAATGEGTGW